MRPPSSPRLCVCLCSSSLLVLCSLAPFDSGCRATDGGGYLYSLCPSNETLTEQCFQAKPLAFVGDTAAVERLLEAGAGPGLIIQGVPGVPWDPFAPP